MVCQSPQVIKAPDSQTEYKKVPCGKCFACKTNRRTEWTIRLKEELTDNNYKCTFTTLTYEDNNLHQDDMGAHLDKKDLQNFFKRLRKALSPRKIRYYAVGEYGTNTYRPHYHVLIYGITKCDIDIIQNAWSLNNEPIGLVHCINANERTIGYITKYHVNKGKTPIGLSPEFATMSRKPAIGAGYLSRMGNWHSETIDRNYHSQYSLKSALPRYYKDRIFTKSQKREIERKFRQDQFTLEEIEKFKKMYPKENFWKQKDQQKQENERRFQDKSKLNRKI